MVWSHWDGQNDDATRVRWQHSHPRYLALLRNSVPTEHFELNANTNGKQTVLQAIYTFLKRRNIQKEYLKLNFVV